MIELLRPFFVWTEWAALNYFIVVNSFYALLLASATNELRMHGRKIRGENRWRILGSNIVPRVSVLAPAYNEATTIAQSLRSLLALHYPNLEVIVVNDGSSDETLEVMKRAFDLVEVHPVFQQHVVTEMIRGLYRSRTHPALFVVDKVNGGKADALNAGLNVAGGELVCAIDADTLIEPDALQRIIRPFIESENVLAAGGTIRVANSCVVENGLVQAAHVPSKPIPGFQVVEYLRAFLFGRLGWNNLGGNLLISGAFGLFRKDVLLEAGGYLDETIGEDLELIVRLRRRAFESKTPHRVVFIPDPVAWTEVPESMRVLARQRDRWHRGLSDVTVRHWRLLFNPRYGAMGMVVFPYYVIGELLAPVAEAIGLIVLAVGIPLGVIDFSFLWLFFLVAYGYGLILTVCALLLEEVSYNRYETVGDRLRMLLWAVLESFGYRQLTVIWRLNGLWKFFRGRQEWGVMERTGLASSGPG